MPFSHQHVLFDLDGTLVDTRAAVIECYRRVFRSHLNADFPPPFHDGHDIFAMRPREMFSRIAPDRTDELYAAYSAAYPDCTDHIAVFPRIKALILALVSAGRKPSLVTNKGLERTLIDLSVAGIARESFVTIVTAEDTVDRKPHPAPILLGLLQAGATADQAIYVGDGPQDILAARAAMMPCIAVTFGFYASAELIPQAPDALVNDVVGLADALGVSLAEDAL